MSATLDFIQENWVAFLSLIVALVGGIPGLVATIKEWKARTNLAGYLYRIIPFQTADSVGNHLVGLILHVSLTNKGAGPLTPVAFQLDCKINNKWSRFERGAIPEGFKLDLAGQKYEYIKVEENDLQRRKGVISSTSPAHGYLCFVSRNLSYEDLLGVYLSMKMRLCCIDLLGRTHSFIMNNDLKQTEIEYMRESPGNGVVVNRDVTD